MNIVGWLTGGAKSTDKVIDGIINTGDKMFYTEEEKTEFDLNRQQLWLEAQKVLVNESSYRAVNRRVVAWSVIIMTTLLTLLTVSSYKMGGVEFAMFIKQTAVDFNWPWAFFGVIGFYFGPHLLSSLNKK